MPGPATSVHGKISCVLLKQINKLFKCSHASLILKIPIYIMMYALCDRVTVASSIQYAKDTSIMANSYNYAKMPPIRGQK